LGVISVAHAQIAFGEIYSLHADQFGEITIPHFSTTATASWSLHSPWSTATQIMLVTDKGQLIRCPVEDIRIAGRSTQGVIVFDTAEDEHVVSVEHIGDDGENGENGNGG
jgi:DNA gyrase/topoisomerase IV subunit A